MVKLTEEMVVARTRMSDFSTVKKLNCWGTELTDVSILRKMKNVELLSFSVNNIETLADFQHCLCLQDLFVRKNNIKDLNEVCYLQGLPNLRNLWLGENPCAEKEGYRLAVIRALPNLEKLDDKKVTPEEVQTALARGRILIHPLDMDASPNQLNLASPERSLEDAPVQEEYPDPDKTNANYGESSPHCYSQNSQYAYEDYDDRQLASRHNGDYEDRRYIEYGGNETAQRQYALISPRAQYPLNESLDERRVDRQNYEFEDRRQLEYSDAQTPLHSRRASLHQNDREDTQIPGWVKHSGKDKCRSQFHYHRRPVTRNSNILSAVLCLVKELDYPSLEVVEMAVRNRMDELEE
ncbi:cilia- and flagella-associated protein 410-like isoform X4 [Prorops nasuta]|uniref:cilia- and flagella-associated protein 410-like isoform X4 n=1 Tax=Prorops nasuta TaxID=863751 RepID=UPI0034CE5388